MVIYSANQFLDVPIHGGIEAMLRGRKEDRKKKKGPEGPKFCKDWEKRLWKEECERKIVRERMWKKECERKVVKKRL